MSTEPTPQQAPQPGGPQPGGDDRMGILERRLAEIQAQNERADPAAPAGPEPARPAAGTPEAAAAAETAHHVPDEVTVDGADKSAPQARAEAHYGEAAEAPPAAEAIASDAPAPLADPDTLPAPAPHAHTVEELAAPLPTVALHSAAALMDAPEPLAALPTSSETPLEDGDAPAAPAYPEAPAVGATAATDAAEAAEAQALSGSEGGAPLTPVAPTPLAPETRAVIAAEAHGDAGALGDADAEYAHAVAAAEATPGAPAVLAAPDFTALDLPAQAHYLVQELRGPNAQRNRKTTLDLVRQYEANVGQARAAARQKFGEGGAAAEAFAFQQPEGQPELNKALQEFREGRAKTAKVEDASRADNLAKKQQLLDQLRQLVEAAETKDSSARLKALQGEWKATGPVPQTDSQPVWDTYHGLLDIYYSKQGRFLEMKDLDRRRNQEAKENLVKRAEGLLALTGINKALDELTKLHEDWKKHRARAQRPARAAVAALHRRLRRPAPAPQGVFRRARGPGESQPGGEKNPCWSASCPSPTLKPTA